MILPRIARSKLLTNYPPYSKTDSKILNAMLCAKKGHYSPTLLAILTISSKSSLALSISSSFPSSFLFMTRKLLAISSSIIIFTMALFLECKVLIKSGCISQQSEQNLINTLLILIVLEIEFKFSSIHSLSS